MNKITVTVYLVFWFLMTIGTFALGGVHILILPYFAAVVSEGIAGVIVFIIGYGIMLAWFVSFAYGLNYVIRKRKTTHT